MWECLVGFIAGYLVGRMWRSMVWIIAIYKNQNHFTWYFIHHSKDLGEYLRYLLFLTLIRHIFAEKIKKTRKTKKFRYLGLFRNIPSFSKFRRHFFAKNSKNSGGIFQNSGTEFRLLMIPVKLKLEIYSE